MLRMLVVGLCLLLSPAAALAQAWPDRPVRIIVPYAAGGGTDLVARVLALKFADAFGQNFIVENKTGASGMIGAQIVAKGAADGYSLLVASPAEIALNHDPEHVARVAAPELASIQSGGTCPTREIGIGRFLVARRRQLASSRRRIH